MDMKAGMSMKEGAEWLWNASRGYRSPILAGILAGTVRIGVSLTFVWFCKHLIDTATHQADGNIILGLAAMAGCIVLQLLLSALVSRLYAHTEISLRNRLRQDLLEHILKSRWNGRETFHSGDMLNRMEEDVRTVTDLLAGSIPLVGTGRRRAVPVLSRPADGCRHPAYHAVGVAVQQALHEADAASDT